MHDLKSVRHDLAELHDGDKLHVDCAFVIIARVNKPAKKVNILFCLQFTQLRVSVENNKKVKTIIFINVTFSIKNVSKP